MKQKKQISKKLYMIGVLLIAFLPRMFFVLQAVPVRTLSDEISTISGAALLAGYDWRETVSHAGYYGFGFYALCAPFFRLFQNPVTIYRGILAVATLAQASTAGICFYICDHYMDMKQDYRMISLISIVCNYAVVTRTTIAYNEHPLILISWILALLLAKFLEKRKVRYILYIYLLLGYGLTLHTRALVLVIGTTMVLVGYLLYHREYKKSILAMGLAGSVYLVADQICNAYRNYIWGAKTVRNAEFKVKGSALLQFDLATIKAWLAIVIGQIFTINFFFCGCVILMVIAAILHIVKTGRTQKSNAIYNAIFSLFILCIGGTIFAQTLSLFPQVRIGIERGDYSIYAFKVVTYIRYFGPYIGPAVLCGLVAIYKQSSKIRSILGWSLLGNGILLKLWLLFVFPYMKKNTATIEAYMPFAYLKNISSFNSTSISMAVLCSIIIGSVLFMILNSKKYESFAILLGCALIYQYGFMATYYDIANQKKQASRYITKSYDFVKDSYDCDTIYVNCDIEREQFYLYQFYFWDSKICIGIPPKDYEGILFSNTEIDEFVQDNILEKYILSEEQIVYVLGT